MKIKCNCIGECSQLEVLDYKNNDCEIQLGKECIYLDTKSIKRLIKYLKKLIN